MTETITDILRRARVIPVLVIEDAAHAVPLARALVAGGLPVIEITLRTGAALDSISSIAAEVPDAVVGAGTILTARDLAAARSAGARFGVSPGSTETLLAAVRDDGLPFLPGVATASEIMRAMEAGFTTLKAFPAAGVGGPSAVGAFAGPFPQATFCPTGGVKLDNAPDYLRQPNIVAVGGTWLAPREALAAGDWMTVEDLARAAAAL